MIQQIVGRYLPDIEQTMRTIVREQLPDEEAFGLMLRYAVGWVNEHDQPYPHQTGKRLRPVILLLANEASGGDWHNALPSAAAVELLHNFSLIHDDIQDDSEMRHRRPTVWKIWGKANAINAGDAMFTLAYTALKHQSAYLPAEQALHIWNIFNTTNLELTRGQHLDLRFEGLEQVSVNDYLSMIRGKTGALLAACGKIGAFVATGDAQVADYYEQFGLNLGIAFQIHDDILGIWGSELVTGKSAASDIASRKKSLPVLYGLNNSGTLRSIYQRPVFGAHDVAEAVAVLDELKAQDFAREQEKVYYDRAMTALQNAKPQGIAAQYLEGLIDFLFQREY